MAAGATGSSQRLAPRVFLAFHDFSLAGPHVLALAQVEGLQRISADASSVGLPAEFTDYVDVQHFAAQSTDAPIVSFVVVQSGAVEETKYWALADALLTLLSDARVQVLTVLASLHLPYAKASSLSAATIPSVYHAVLNASADVASNSSENLNEQDVTAFEPMDGTWELKDRFLAALVHLLRVEQSPRAHLLLTKGYRPGRDHAGTYEAVDALAAALAAFTRARVACDAQTLKTALPRRLAERFVDVNTAHESEHHAMLYH